ncbi:MAG: outer membrane protein assembly factor BamB family protein [Chloroflexota bacterium]
MATPVRNRDPSSAAADSPPSAAASTGASPTAGASPGGGAGDASDASSWPTYHGNGQRTGVGPSQPAFGAPHHQWTATLDGTIYGEPLVAGGRLIVATENDSVYALDPSTGQVVWRQHVGQPVPGSQLPCGDVNPSGMTSTPVVDTAHGVVYAVGRLQPVHHELFALDLATGAVRFHRSIDPPGANPRNLQQRAGLALAGSRVYVPFGGNYGDCGAYHGWVIAAPASGQGSLLAYGVPTAREGGIWAPPGATIDSHGDLLVAIGNAASVTTFDYGNAVVRLSPDLKVLDYWAPRNWATLSREDLDIGSVGPTPLQGGRIFQSGKDGTGYLLNASHLGGIGGELFSQHICSGAYGGTAYQAPLVYVPCRDGLVAVRTGGDRFTVAWRAGGGTLNSPIVAYGSIWSVNTASAQLLQLDPATGAVRSRTALGGPAIAHFISPTASGGRLVVSSGPRVLAFGP